VLRTVGAFIISVVLVLVSGNAFPQVLSEFRSTEPGSWLFGALHLVIGTSTVAGAIGVLMRARWAAPSIALFGIAAAGLLVSQPMYEPMTSEAERAIWIGAAAVLAVAAGMGWSAHRLARPATTAHTSADPAPLQRPSAALLPDAQAAAEFIIAPGAHQRASRAASVRSSDDPPPTTDGPTQDRNDRR